MKEVFQTIYQTNGFNGTDSISGPGSSVNATKKLIEDLPDVFDLLSIQSFLDAPCGDFHWMRHVPHYMNYTGADIVPELIEKNKKLYPGIKFITLDIVNDPIDKYDMIFVRDCLVHLPNEMIVQALKNVKRSGSKWFASTTFPVLGTNRDIKVGEWRPINLQKYGLGRPFMILNEGCQEGFPDKSIGIWESKTINL